MSTPRIKFYSKAGMMPDGTIGGFTIKNTSDQDITLTSITDEQGNQHPYEKAHLSSKMGERDAFISAVDPSGKYKVSYTCEDGSQATETIHVR